MKNAKLALRILLIGLGMISLNVFPSTVFSQDTTSSRIELKAWAGKSKIGSDEDLVFTVQAVWEGELDRFQIQPIRPPQCKLLEILGSSSINETKIIEGKRKTFKTFNFILKPTRQGEGEVGGVEFRYVDPITQDTSSLSTQPLLVQIGPPLRKETGDAIIYLVLILVIFFTTLTYLVIRKREKESKKEDIKTEEKVEKPLEEEISAQLSSLEPLLSSEKMDEFFSGVYRLATKYLEKKYHIMTSGKTTPEIMKSLSGFSLEEKRIKLLESILRKCDLVKFAKEKVEKRNGEEVLKNFKTFLEQS